MIVGAHSLIYSRKPEADRALLRDVFKLPHVDVGEGWLIFGLPPAEVAVHPGESNDEYGFSLMVADIAAFVAAMKKHSVACDKVADHGYGLVTNVTLPGGGKLQIYEPRHARPKAMPAASGARAKRAAAKPAPKRTAKTA